MWFYNNEKLCKRVFIGLYLIIIDGDGITVKDCGDELEKYGRCGNLNVPQGALYAMMR